MNKFTLLVGLLLSISACTKQSDNNPEVADKPGVILEAGVGVVTGSGALGELNSTDSKILTIRISNSGDAPLVGPPSIDNTDFSIVYQSGCASIAPKKSCTLKVNFNAAGKAFGPYSANLNLDSAFVELSATILDPNPSQSFNVSFSAEPLDFGTITDKQTSTKNLTITNSGTVAIENQSVIAPSLASGFKVSYDNCSNKKILPGKNCLLKISMIGSTTIGTFEADLTFAGNFVTLTGQSVSSTGTSVLGSPNVQLLVNNVVSTSHDFGALTGTQNKQLIVTAKNIGNKASEVSSAALTASTNFSILFNQCLNKSLAPNSSCQIRVLFSAAGKSPASYSDSLTFAGQTLSLSAVLGCVAGYQEQEGLCVPEEPTVSLYNQDYSLVSSINLGDANEGDRISKVLIVKNESPTQQVLNFGYDGPDWGLNITTCNYGTNSYIIAGNSECLITIYFDNKLESGQDIQAQGNLYFNGQTIPLTSNKITDIEWLEIPEGKYTAQSGAWNTVDTGGSRVDSTNYVNNNFIQGDTLSHEIVANENVQINSLFVPYDKINYQILDSQGNPIPQHLNENSSMIEFENTLNLMAGDHIKVILTFPYAQSNVRIYDNITTLNNGLSFSSVLKNGTSLGGKWTVNAIKTHVDYDASVQVSFSQFSFGSQNSLDLIEGRKIKLKALRLKQVGFLIEEDSTLINLPQYVGFPRLQISYQNMFLMDFGDLGQKFPVANNEEETSNLSGDNTFLFPEGINSATLQWRIFSTNRITRDSVLKIPLIKNP